MTTGRGRSVEEFQSQYNPTEEVRFLRARVKELETSLETEKQATGEQRILALALTEAIEAARPVKLTYKPQKGSALPITHVLHLTDLHYGEVVKGTEVEQFNEFSPEIAETRLKMLASKILDKTETMRAGYKVQDLHILGTADYISGDIHRELSVTNAFPCPMQAVRCGYALGGLVMMLAPHFQRITVDMITLDNHGRLTVKHQAAEGGLNNWSYVVGEILKQHVRNQSNIAVNVHAHASTIVPIGAEKYLLFHGHQLRGWSGIPYYGFDRRVALEAVKRMAFPAKAFTKLLCGHFHVSVDAPYWGIGGSLSGTNAYDHANGRHMSAHQTSWFCHPEHGQFDFTRWWLD